MFTGQISEGYILYLQKGTQPYVLYKLISVFLLFNILLTCLTDKAPHY